MERSILALDLATKTGWAHSCGESGVWDFAIKSDESSGMRLIRFRGKLTEVYRAVGLDLIVFEEISVARGVKANMDSIKLNSKLQAVLEEFCVENGIEHCSVNLQTLKAYALPVIVGTKQIRDKDAMIAAALEKWKGREFADDNEVDAMWLLDYTQQKICIDSSTSTVPVIKNVKPKKKSTAKQVAQELSQHFLKTGQFDTKM